MTVWFDQNRKQWRYEFQVQGQRINSNLYPTKAIAKSEEAEHRKRLRQKTEIPTGTAFSSVANTYLDYARRRYADQTYRYKAGVLSENNDAEIIQFPGKEEDKIKFTSVQQQGKIDGEVIRIGGSKDIVPIMLAVEGREISGCHAKRSIAKELAKYLFEPVRLYGEGRWDRNEDGEWNLVNFIVDRFDVPQESTLSKTVIALRGLKGEWGEDALYDLLESRHSTEEAH